MFVAAWLVALTISPVTAPFRVVDVSAPIGEVPVQEWSAVGKISDDAADLLLIIEPAVDAQPAVGLVVHHSVVADHPQLPPAVLRL